MLQVMQMMSPELIRVEGTARQTVSQEGRTVSFEDARKAAVQELNKQNTEWFKNEFRQDLENIASDRSVVRCAVDVSEEGFVAMQENAAYRQQITALIAKDLGSSYAPRQASVYVKIGKTLDDYQVNSWSAGDDSEFKRISQGSFYRREGQSFVTRTMESLTPSAFRIFRDHLQMQLEKLDNGPAADVPQPMSITTSIYDAMGYENPQIRAFEA